VDPLDPFLAIKVAVTRKGDPYNNHSLSYGNPKYIDQRFNGTGLSLSDALHGYTINGASFLRADQQIGSLEKGKLADIIVLNRSLSTTPEDELARTKVLLTMLGGEVQYIAEGASFGNLTAKFPNTGSGKVPRD